tara:strand:- start:56 stop:322 length:267 start_codon:yes stop_codon:yes gene_type:complete
MAFFNSFQISRSFLDGFRRILVLNRYFGNLQNTFMVLISTWLPAIDSQFLQIEKMYFAKTRKVFWSQICLIREQDVVNRSRRESIPSL